MTDLTSYRDGVRRSLPELAMIQDAALREQVVEAWALALAETEFAGRAARMRSATWRPTGRRRRQSLPAALW